MAQVTCESVAAYIVHIRELGDRAPNYGGHIQPRPRALCDAEIAWDMQMDVEHATCTMCVRLATKPA